MVDLTFFLLLACVLLLIMLVGLFLHYKNKIKVHRMEIVHNRSGEPSSQEIEEMEITQLIEVSVKDKLELLGRLSDNYFRLKVRLEEGDGSGRRPDGALEVMISEFCDVLKSLKDYNRTIDILEKSLNATEQGVIKRLRDEFPVFKDTDYAFLVLFFSRVPVKSIAFVMGVSESAVRMRKTRYKQFFQSKGTNIATFFGEKLNS